MQLINKNISAKLEFTKPFELSEDSISNISEDCLYLNIYAPVDDNFMIKKKPILFVIHGGDGNTGTGALDITEPSIFVTFTDTIVVTINYRLGIFGFLSLNGNDGILFFYF
jgi:para-nitrobenzyl esterase